MTQLARLAIALHLPHSTVCLSTGYNRDKLCLNIQAGLFLWQQLLPRKADAAREELLKLDIAGVRLILTNCTLFRLALTA